MDSHDRGTNLGPAARAGPTAAPTATAPPARRLLDAAAGPLHPTARDTLLAAVDAGWADPARLYAEGRRARALLDRSREVVAAGLSVRPTEVSLLPSGPSALTRAVEGLLYAARRRGARTVASAVEHSAVLVPGRARAASADDAALLAEVPVDGRGRVDLDSWSAALGVEGTVVAALQSANGEVGTRQPLQEAREACRRHGIPLVVDAMASLGRDEVPDDWDVLVGDARAWGGPPLGVLVVRERVRWQWEGSRADVEGGRTDVTPWIPLALAAAEAWQQTASARTVDAAGARGLVDAIRTSAARVPDTEVVGDPDDRLPHVVTFSSLYVDGEALVGAFDRAGFAVASGSACTSSTLEPSHVLAAMGVLTHGNVRVTLPLRAVSPGRDADVEAFCSAIGPTVEAVRRELGVAGL
ncbi:aminotransferase V [Intrasporangium oryzae NRRL B-24470]|uniref:Aminotransferase V n=1 Tax=Intrasporangium oryzae NRRL B-24470 TaxID=1386089 RepID=W9G3J9_9MICO|nr:aminotransferase class V-fold PLP-dependent enzyme [Intrasporangium oryzae]EWT00565.1 aminotransferase V [Intrasporangium oryzae NRRL B-24470]